MPYRVDSGVELARPKRTSQGFLRVDGFASRPGVYRYADPHYPNGVRLELRPRSEVFSPGSLASFEGAPITDGHPPKGEVTSANLRQVPRVGTVLGRGVRADADDAVAVPLQFEDKDAVARLEHREKTQLSPGYRIDLEMTAGVDPEFGPYHVIQRNIRVNHMAWVKGARGGDGMRIRMDEADAEVGELVTHAAPRRGVTMDQEEQIRLLKTQLAEAERLGKQRQDAADEANGRAEKAEAAVGPLRERIHELETQIANGATEVETSAISRERLRADEAEEALRQVDERFEAGVRARANLMHRARAVLGDEFRMDDLSERQIHSAVIKRLDPRADVKAPSDAFLSGQFETLLELHNRTARSLSRVSESFVRHDQADAQPDQKAQRMKSFRDQWKQPLPNDIRARRGERA